CIPTLHLSRELIAADLPRGTLSSFALFLPDRLETAAASSAQKPRDGAWECCRHYRWVPAPLLCVGGPWRQVPRGPPWALHPRLCFVGRGLCPLTARGFCRRALLASENPYFSVVRVC
ncbi:unnamed protein product, partial [Ixodes persulcatus]